jgi:hypothetical protein
MSQPGSAPSETDLRFELVRLRYGARLTAEQLDVLRHAVAAIVDQVTTLRSVRLTNADEPLPRFAAFRADE